ncbi:hypothetical protein B0H34DRAFT_274194 [Crassisporium funariophilum]|nr:hypothetical protein B0H34DRAFT_274194 [Crassisporium funariophilum]
MSTTTRYRHPFVIPSFHVCSSRRPPQAVLSPGGPGPCPLPGRSWPATCTRNLLLSSLPTDHDPMVGCLSRPLGWLFCPLFPSSSLAVVVRLSSLTSILQPLFSSSRPVAHEHPNPCRVVHSSPYTFQSNMLLPSTSLRQNYLSRRSPVDLGSVPSPDDIQLRCLTILLRPPSCSPPVRPLGHPEPFLCYHLQTSSISWLASFPAPFRRRPAAHRHSVPPLRSPPESCRQSCRSRRPSTVIPLLPPLDVIQLGWLASSPQHPSCGP